MSEKSPKQQFIEYGLRSLGWPVININIDDEQIEDRIIEAVQYYNDFHSEGTEHLFYNYPAITEIDIANGYIEVPNNISSVVRAFNFQDKMSLTSGNYIMDLRYQIRSMGLFDFASSSFLQYYTTMQHLRTLEILFTGEIPIEYVKSTNRCYLFQAWSKNGCDVGDNILLEVYVDISPEDFPKVYNDKWLKKYFCALLKKQWGSNLMKYSDVPLVGGIRLNGDIIYNESIREIEQLQQEMITTYARPLEFYTN